MRRHLGQILAEISGTRVGPAERRFPAFQVCGCVGILLALALSLMLVERLGLSQLALFGITAIVILTFLALMLMTRILVGRESIIFYHHEIAAIASIALWLRLIKLPV